MPRGLAASCVEEPKKHSFGVFPLVTTARDICQNYNIVLYMRHLPVSAVEIHIETRSMLRQLTWPTFSGVEEPRGLKLIRQFSAN
jgi:hypothetical protein